MATPCNLITKEYNDGTITVGNGKVLVSYNDSARKTIIRPENHFPILHPDSDLPRGIIFGNSPADAIKIINNEALAVIIRPTWRDSLLEVCADIRFPETEHPNVEDATFRQSHPWIYHYALEDNGTLATREMSFDDETNVFLKNIVTARKFFGPAWPFINKTFEAIAQGLASITPNSSTICGDLLVYHPGMYDDMHTDDGELQAFSSLAGQGAWLAPYATDEDLNALYAEMPAYKDGVFELATGDIIFFGDKFKHSGATVTRPDGMRIVAASTPVYV